MTLSPGTIISTPAYKLIDHWGILTERGTVISNSKRHGRVVEESLESFCNGNVMKVVGYLGKLSSAEVIARARECIDKPWDAIKSNCEHFAHHAHGLKPNSPQLLLGIGALAILAAIIFGGK